MSTFKKLEINVLKDYLSSCYLEQENTILICGINLLEKLETENNIEVNYRTPKESVDLSSLIKNTIKNIFDDKLEKINVKVDIFCIKTDINTFSACINAFSICVLQSGLPLKDIVVAKTKNIGNGIHLAYQIYNNSISQLSFDEEIEFQNLRKYLFEMMKECKVIGEEIKNVLISFNS